MHHNVGTRRGSDRFAGKMCREVLHAKAVEDKSKRGWKQTRVRRVGCRTVDERPSAGCLFLTWPGQAVAGVSG